MSGDPVESFEAWANARQHGLLRVAYLLTGDLGRAEDLLQEALLKVALRWRRLRQPEPRRYVRVVLYPRSGVVVAPSTDADDGKPT